MCSVLAAATSLIPTVVVGLVVAAVVRTVVAAMLSLAFDMHLPVSIAMTLACLARIELAQSARLRLVEHILKRGGARHQNLNVRSGKPCHGVATHAADHDGVELHARELLHRSTLTVGMMLVRVAENLDLGRFGIDQAEIWGAAEVSEHLGLDSLVSPRRYADAHLLHPF